MSHGHGQTLEAGAHLLITMVIDIPMVRYRVRRKRSFPNDIFDIQTCLTYAVVNTRRKLDDLSN